MATYWGEIDYFATGEGRHIWYYIGYAESEEQFKAKMFSELSIDPYYQIGITIGTEVDEQTPIMIFQHWRTLTSITNGERHCFGEFKYHINYNYS